MPLLVEKRISLIEQPFPIADDAQLDGFQSPIPIAADESVQSLLDIRSLLNRFDVVNIKLDKCGGLTEGLAMARLAHEYGLGTMVGNMSGTSLAMAPAFLLGQLCDVVDLDGPAFLAADREVRVNYSNGCIRCPEDLWGGSPS
jgi:L-alanine-DL-glutamate epimerase-like enolase superfamily enzyme